MEIRDDSADNGYHSNDNLTWCQSFGIRTYIPERESPHGRRWSDKSEEEKRVVYNNRRRVCGKRGKQSGRLHSEYTERSFAHVCETGGARRSRLRGLAHVFKRYLMYVATRNLGVMMRALFNMGTPKGLQTEGEASPCAACGPWAAADRHGRRTPSNVSSEYLAVKSLGPKFLVYYIEPVMSKQTGGRWFGDCRYVAQQYARGAGVSQPSNLPHSATPS